MKGIQISLHDVLSKTLTTHWVTRWDLFPPTFLALVNKIESVKSSKDVQNVFLGLFFFKYSTKTRCYTACLDLITKRRENDFLALNGNLNTTDIMWFTRCFRLRQAASWIIEWTEPERPLFRNLRHLPSDQLDSEKIPNLSLHQVWVSVSNSVQFEMSFYNPSKKHRSMPSSKVLSKNWLSLIAFTDVKLFGLLPFVKGTVWARYSN